MGNGKYTPIWISASKAYAVEIDVFKIEKGPVTVLQNDLKGAVYRSCFVRVVKFT